MSCADAEQSIAVSHRAVVGLDADALGEEAWRAEQGHGCLFHSCSGSLGIRLGAAAAGLDNKEKCRTSTGEATLPQTPPRTDREEPPHPAAAVHGARLERVVDAHLREQARRRGEHPPADAPDGDGGPRLEDVAAGGDGHEPREDAVHEQGDVPGLVDDDGEDERAEAPAGGAEGRVGADAGDDLGGADDAAGGAAVEAVPARRWEGRGATRAPVSTEAEAAATPASPFYRPAGSTQGVREAQLRRLCLGGRVRAHQPNQSMRVPSAANGVLWPGIGLAVPSEL